MYTVLTPIPVTLITGFLGAGKTTLIRHLLKTANGKRLALIINEFGDIGIDGEVLKACGNEDCGEEDIVELANGCLCCTVRSDLVLTLADLIDRVQSGKIAALMLGGRMPVTRSIPVSWYETQNIHHVTILDFRDLAAEKGATIVRDWYFAKERPIGRLAANSRAEFAVFELAR